MYVFPSATLHLHVYRSAGDRAETYMNLKVGVTKIGQLKKIMSNAVWAVWATTQRKADMNRETLNNVCLFVVYLLCYRIGGNR